MKSATYKQAFQRKRQKGAITMFSAILILILLTELILYATQVGIFEQLGSLAQNRSRKQRLAPTLSDGEGICRIQSHVGAYTTRIGARIGPSMSALRLQPARSLPQQCDWPSAVHMNARID